MMPIDKEDCPASFALVTEFRQRNPWSSLLQAVQISAVFWYWVGEKESNQRIGS